MSAAAARNLAKNNDAYAHSHTPSIPFSRFPNQAALLILACLDPRSNPSEFWSLPSESGPGIIRNAGGRAADALRSMRVISAVMANGRNTLGAVAVVHHTDCGMMAFDHGFIAGRIKGRLGEGEGEEGLEAEVDGMEFGEFVDPEASVRADMALIKADPFLPKDLEVVGYIHDVFTGKTTEVV